MDLKLQADALLSNESGIYNWIQLLNFFSEHSHKLDNPTKKRIYLRCEEYRMAYSTSNDTIRREDINPNIYSDLSFLEEKQEENYKVVTDFQLLQVSMV